MDTDLVPRLRTVHLLFCASFAIATPAFAQNSTPEDIASARALGTEGVRLADSGDCAAAIPKLEAAERLYHAPTTLERLGECQVNLGRLVAGTESLNRVVRETLAPGGPPAFVMAQHRASEVLASAKPKIGRLRIHIDGAPADKVTVTVDGMNVPSVLFDGDRATDPGMHEVRATASGYRTETATVQVAPGADAAVSLKLELDANAGAPPAYSSQSTAPSLGRATTASPPSASSSASGSTGPNRLPAIIALSIGGAGVAVGSVFGILALGTKSSLDNACVISKKMCPASSQGDIDDLSTRSTISNVGFIVGIAGVAVGTVLFVTAHGEGSAPPGASGTAPRMRVRPWVGLGSAGLGGTFE